MATLGLMWHEEIETHGFSIMPGVVCSDKLHQLEGALLNGGLPRSRAGIRHLMRNPAVCALARSDSLMAIARKVLGEEVFPFRATFFDKSPDSNWLVVWHQDTALPLEERKDRVGWGPWSVKDAVVYAHAPSSALLKILALRVHMDDCTSENGALRVLSRTHQLGVLTDDSIEELASRITPVECETTKGAIVAMRPLIVHASSKSRIQMPRRVLHIEYASMREIDEGLHLAVA